MAQPKERRGKDLTVEEAGRLGGEKVARKYGHGHFEEIGRKGGQRGGEAVAGKYGHEHFEEIGRLGGEAVSEKYGHEHFEEIGRKGGEKVRDLIEKGRRSGGPEE
ncbi:MAG: general stress protein B [Chloroflexota bacterium]